MKKFVIFSNRIRCAVLVCIFAGFGFLLIAAAFIAPIFWFVAMAWFAFSLLALWNTIRSILSPAIELNWSGTDLSVRRPSDAATAQIAEAEWLYANPTSVVVRSKTSLPRFNHGHVRSNGRELTVDGFHGSGLDNLGKVLEPLGPRKHWLWRHMAF